MLSYHILVCDHTRQRLDRHLKRKLESIVKANHIVLIAEEVDANLPDAEQKSIARTLAATEKIPWLSIDMTFEQQEAAGIKDALDDARDLQRQNINAYAKRANDLRENYWLDRIEQECQKQGITNGTVLIICGPRHQPSLAEKGRNRGIGKIDFSEYRGLRLGEPE